MVTRRQSTARTNEGSVASTTNSSNSISATGAAFDLPKFKKLFDQVYNQWFQTTLIREDLRKTVESTDISIELFEKLTLNRQFQRYITLVDGRIRFDEPPSDPHGEIVGCVIEMISTQVGGTNSQATFSMTSDNGSIPSRCF